MLLFLICRPSNTLMKLFQILSDPKAYEYVNGTAIHWYTDDLFPSSRLTELHKYFPDKFILNTEASFRKLVSISLRQKKKTII